MKLDLSNVEFSLADKKKGITVPNELTEELAEDIGLHIGDGAIEIKKNRKSPISITHSSNKYEKDHLEYVITLKKKLYNICNYRIVKRNNGRGLSFCSLVISTFYASVFDIPWGKKKDLDVPYIIKNSKNKNMIISFIRGLVDTDFGLILRNKYGKIYPSMEGASSSKKLILSLSYLFDILGIKHYTYYNEKTFDKRTNKTYTRHKIIVNGFDRVSYFLNIIKPKNSKYIRRIKKMGLARFELAISSSLREDEGLTPV